MSPFIKKTIRIASYAALFIIAAFIALIPFIKKERAYTTDFSPEARDVHADIPAGTPTGDSSSSDGDDGF